MIVILCINGRNVQFVAQEIVREKTRDNMPLWWNGRHSWFRPRCSKGCAGSSPVSGTMDKDEKVVVIDTAEKLLKHFGKPRSDEERELLRLQASMQPPYPYLVVAETGERYEV